MSLSAHITLEIEGISEPLRVTRFTGYEQLHASFRFELTVLARPHGDTPLSLDAEQLLGARAHITLEGEPPRHIVGVVDEVHAEGEGFRVVVAPPVAALADVLDYRVFVDLDVVSIARTLLSEHGIEMDTRLGGVPAARPQTVLAWEPVLDFLARILADEGLTWLAETSNQTARIVLTDGPSGASPIDGDETLPFGAGQEGGLEGVASVFGTELRRVLTVEKVTLSDFDFERPTVDPTASAGQGALERFEPLAGARTSDVAARRAAARLDELAGHRLTLRGRSNSRRLAAGHTFTLRGAPHPAENGAWLVVSLRHEGRDFGAAGGDGSASYEGTFVAIPAEQAYRPPRAQAPMPGGLQMGTVTGPAGSEIHTEPHGRIKTRLRWDRRGRDDETASAWIRPVQPPLSGGSSCPASAGRCSSASGAPQRTSPTSSGASTTAYTSPPRACPGRRSGARSARAPRRAAGRRTCCGWTTRPASRGSPWSPRRT